MIENKTLRIIQLNDVAGVASNYVSGLCELGQDTKLIQPTIGTYWFGGSKITKILLPFIRTKEAIELKRYYKRNDIDILHVHYASLAYLPLITHLPYYLHVHGKDVREDLKSPLLKGLTRRAILSAKMVFCATPDLMDQIIPLRPDAKYLPNPVDLSSFYPKSIEHKPKSILCISKLDNHKGINEIIDALNILWKQDPNLTVGMFNFGNNVKEAQPFIQKNQKRLKLINRISHEKMNELINSYDIILGQQSKTARILTLSELEAMACGKPVIVNFQYPQWYSSPPPVIVTTTPQEIADGIFRIIQNPKLGEDLGKSARAWVITNHDQMNSSKTLLSYYLDAK